MKKSMHETAWRRGCFPWERGRNSKFSRFYSRLISAHSDLLVVSGSDNALFPGALPYPEVFADDGVGIAGESGAMRWSMSFLNAWVAWSNFVVLGSPDSVGTAQEPRVKYRCQKEMRAFTDDLLGEVVEFFDKSGFCTDSFQCDGKRRTLEEAIEACRDLHGSYTIPGVVSGEKPVSTAIPVVASRVAIPEQAGTVELADWLPPERQQVVSDLSKLRQPEHLWDEVVPAFHNVPFDEEARLVRRLLDHGMVELVEESKLPRTSCGKLLTGGFFCVKKSDSEDRLIYDRRPENATMTKLGWAKLPSGACFTKLLLLPNEFLRGSGDDLKTYYYTLALPTNWVPYNSVGRRVKKDIVKEFGGNPDLHYRVAMRVLGMGDTNACCIAQAVHEHVLQQQGLLKAEHKLVYGEPIPQASLFEGAYLDDLLVAYKKSMPYEIPLDDSFEPPAAQEDDLDVLQVRRAEAAYEAAGLPRALHKSFRQQSHFKAWGAEIDRVKGKVGCPLQTRRGIWSLVVQLVEIGACTKRILQQVMGYVCFCFQFRREFYALQHHIYKYIDQMSESGEVKLPPFVLDELRSMALHLPFCEWNMRRSIASTLLATDATPTTAGATRADLSDELGRLLWRQTEIKGEAVRLDRESPLPSWNDGELPKEPSRVASQVGECLSWWTTASYSFRQTSHINLQEARALRREVALMASNRENRGTVQLALNDSRVVCGAVTKGRSSSFKLNGILRSMIPFLTLGNLALGLLWIETMSNPADYPSRFKIPPTPRDPPQWLQQLMVSRCFLPGLEVFAGSARLTRACRKLGINMLDPVDILWGADAFDSWIDDMNLRIMIGWLWVAPPCGSFSALRNLDRGGPLRPKGCPEGDERNPEILRGNALWRRGLALCWLAWKRGIPFFLEHPKGSKAWLWRGTQQLTQAAGVFVVEVHWCQYCDHERVGPPNRKPTRIVGSGTWVKSIARCCHGGHVHGRPLRGSRAKAAGAYPWGFCEEFGKAFLKHYGEAGECRSFQGLSQKPA